MRYGEGDHAANCLADDPAVLDDEAVRAVLDANLAILTASLDEGEPVLDALDRK
jgi:hypothetical protein